MGSRAQPCCRGPGSAGGTLGRPPLPGRALSVAAQQGVKPWGPRAVEEEGDREMVSELAGARCPETPRRSPGPLPGLCRPLGRPCRCSEGAHCSFLGQAPGGASSGKTGVLGQVPFPLPSGAPEVGGNGHFSKIQCGSWALLTAHCSQTPPDTHLHSPVMTHDRERVAGSRPWAGAGGRRVPAC